MGGLLLVYDGATWIGTTPATLQNMALLGVGTTADAANPFSAKLNAALWTARTAAEGGTGDMFYTMNKEATGDDLGLTLQTGLVTKALVGLFGSTGFRLAVSADGSTFFDGLSVDNATGILDQPRLPPLLQKGPIRLEDLVDDRDERVELRAHRRLRSPVSRWHRVLQYLPDRLAIDPEQSLRRAFVHPFYMARPAHPTKKIHGMYLLALSSLPKAQGADFFPATVRPPDRIR